MNRAMQCLFAYALILLLGAGAALAQPMGASAGHDLDALWTEAQAKHDLAAEDAVILLESRQVTVQDNGDVATRIHRVVWVGTSLGIRHYADLRVPWNSATSALDVEVLRTWMDGRWWPDAERLSESAIVHTLPYAVRNAYDYGAMRETMLLHDGVELPCIMETAYTITERGLPAADGVFVLPQADPTVLVELTVRAMGDRKIQHLSLNGAPAAEAVDQGWSWSVADVPAMALPHAAVPTVSEPTAAWTTWSNHDAVVRAWTEAFDGAAATVDLEAMGPALQEHLQSAAGEAARIRAVTAFVTATVATTHYDDSFWRFAPRPAARVWASGYGHALDLAVLTTGILRALDFDVVPVFVGPRSNEGLLAAPIASGLGHLKLAVSWSAEADGLVVDPAQGSVAAASGLTGQLVAPMQVPFTLQADLPRAGTLDVSLVLTPGEAGAWNGSGQIVAVGPLSFGDRSGAGRTALADQVAAVTGSVLAGAASSECGLQSLTPQAVTADFAVALPAAEPDASVVPSAPNASPLHWQIGAPSSGVLDALAANVRLTDTTREAPVLLPAPLRQTVQVRVDLTGRQVAHLPATREFNNAAGSFKVTAEVKDGWLNYSRELQLNGGRHESAAWPQLRALLLEEDDAANGTIVLEATSAE